MRVEKAECPEPLGEKDRGNQNCRDGGGHLRNGQGTNGNCGRRRNGRAKWKTGG